MHYSLFELNSCMIKLLLLLVTIPFTLATLAQRIPLKPERLQANQVSMSFEKIGGKQALRVAKDTTLKKVDEPSFVKIKGLTIKDGVIEVKVLSRLLPTASENDRGFIGLAFRINEDNSKYECIYIRPTNGRANDQVRRNHSIQYYSYPDYKFDRLRKEAPERYESYADMQLNQWITMRIEFKGSQAKLFLDNQNQPVLIVNDLKHGPGLSGSIGLWVDVGTEGFFKDLKVK